MIDTDMPLWWKVIQIIGWVEIAAFVSFLPFEKKHEYLYMVQKKLPNNILTPIISIVIAIPIIWAGLFACLSYCVFVFFLWLITK